MSKGKKIHESEGGDFVCCFLLFYWVCVQWGGGGYLGNNHEHDVVYEMTWVICSVRALEVEPEDIFWGGIEHGHHKNI